MNISQVPIKRLMKFVRVDGEVTTDGIRRALGMFHPREHPIYG